MTKLFLRTLTVVLVGIFGVYLSNNKIFEEISYQNNNLQYLCQMLDISSICNGSQHNKEPKPSSLVLHQLNYRNQQQQQKIFQQRYTKKRTGEIIHTPSLHHILKGSIITAPPEDMNMELHYEAKNGRTQILPVRMDMQKLERSVAVSKSQGMMQAGINTYKLVVKQKDTTIANIPLQLNSHAQEITVGEYTLYLDPQFFYDDENIVQTTPTFDGHLTNRIMYGCHNPDAEKILLKDHIQYMTVPACLQYDETIGKILLFAPNTSETNIDTRFFDIVTPDQELIYTKFPLYKNYYGQWYQNFISYENTGDTLGMYETSPGRFGNDFHYQKLGGGKVVLDIQYDSKGSIWIKNKHEQLLLSLYDDNDRFDSIIFPGLQSSYLPNTQRKPVSGRSGLVYPISGTIIGFPSLGEPTRSLTIGVQPNSITITDGIKDITYTLDNLSKPNIVSEYRGNLHKNCNDIPTKIISSHGSESIKGYLQTYYIVGTGKGKYTIQLQKNGKSIPINSYGDFFSATLSKDIGTLGIGRNTYDVNIQDAYGTTICHQSLSLFIVN